MKTSTLALSLIFTVNIVISQITENFNNDFIFQTSGWKGDSSKFTINSLEQLQLNDNQAGTATLCRSHNINNLNWKVWEFQLRLNFSPSSGNFARVYMASPDSSLTINSEGLYLQFGESGSGDAIRLMHQSGTISELLTGPPNLINSSFDIHVRISVDSTSLWRMEIFDTQQASFLTVDSAIVNMLLPGNYFGLYYQYTSSNATKFYFDELFVGNIPVDSFAPEINQITLINSNKLLVHFDEQIDSNSLDNVQLQTSSGTFLEHTVEYGDSPKQLLFNFSYPLVNDSLYEFELSGFNDALMNTGDTSFTTHVIFGEEVLPGDVIFNEFMIDPTPSIGLAEVEYLELYNRSQKVFNLNQLKLINDTDSLPFSEAWLKPNSYTVVCDINDTLHFVNSNGLADFPNLGNSEEELVLMDTSGVIIDNVHYTTDYFDGEQNAGNGRSLALMYPNYSCKSQEHWWGSLEDLGGSPGMENTGVDWNFDSRSPRVEAASILDSATLKIDFDEQMRPLDLIADTLLVHGLTLIDMVWQERQVELTFDHAFPVNQYFDVVLQNLVDCNGNYLDTVFEILQPVKMEKGDVIISELLFNPITGGSDYVELYNRSNKHISLEGVGLSKNVEEIYTIDTALILAPQTYFYFSEDISFQKQHYPFVGQNNDWEMQLPNFPNDSGSVFLIDTQDVYDVFNYSEKMHFDYLEDVNGVALERINLQGKTGKWYSAGSNVNYGTPGFKNSQITQGGPSSKLSISPKIFTPNGDGEKDFTSIYYSHNGNKYMLSMKIYSEEGMVVKSLFNNVLQGFSGVVLWDGMDEENHICNIGNYIIVAEFLDLESQQLQVCRQILILNGN